ncbi:hypothetical protein FQN53_000888 [Emmonsiellopsis sp. PD_33]|nr:hypothetical protein FQN53_000888 [Emmonsiellopsis sp. PD_33]
MWDYSDSEPDDDTMVRRCAYCGRFANVDDMNEETGLCLKCNEAIYKTAKGSISPPKSKGSGGKGGRVGAALSSMAAVEVDDDSSDVGSITSIHSDLEDDEGDHGVDEVGSGRKFRGSGSNRPGGKGELCARCWNKPSTKILYNTPICEDCYVVAQEKRSLFSKQEHTRGTKAKQNMYGHRAESYSSSPDSQKRYQPPTPHLQPGKRLTRVCDSCRQKRKRCQHRRVVDEDDPEADFRRKRSKKQRLSMETTSAEEGGSSSPDSNRSSSVIDVTDTVIISETTPEPPTIPTTTNTTNTTSFTSISAATSTPTTTPTSSTAAPTTSTPLTTDGYSTTNLRRSIEESVHLVYSREMERLVQDAEGKLTDAANSLDAVKTHMAGWLRRVQGGCDL